MSLPLRILLALGLATVLGILAQGLDLSLLKQLAPILEPVGTLWVNAIRMTVIPLVVALLITAINEQSSSKQLAAVGSRTFVIFVVMVFVTAMVTAVVAPFLLSLNELDVTLEQVGDRASDVTLPPFREWFTSLLPTNPLQAAVDNQMLPLVVFTLLFAFAIRQVSDKHSAGLLAFFFGLREAMLVLVGWVMWIAPLGVFCLVFDLTLKTGPAFVGAMGYFVLVACGLVCCITLALYPLAVFVGGQRFVQFARACAPAQIVAFSTRSSLASLPAMFTATKNLELDDKVSGLVLPVAVSVFKYASATARTTGTYFVAMLYGVELSTVELFSIAAAVGVLTFYSPGIPSGALLVMTPLYTAFGLPLEGLALLIGLDLIVDMFITMGNATANITVTSLISRNRTSSPSKTS